MILKKILFFNILCFTVTSLLAQGLKVEAGSCIKIEENTTLDISNGGDLYLKSNSTNDASLIDLGSLSYSGGGEAMVERYLTNSKWHIISTPVSTVQSGQFEGDYLQMHDETTNLWTDIASLNYNLIPAKGYGIWIDDGPTTEIFSGITNTGNKEFNFTRTDMVNDTAEGWNLVGNPYPSILDWNAITIPVNLGGAFWVFDPTLGESGSFRYYIDGGGDSNTADQYISSGQGFFVRATGSGTLQFTNSVRISQAASFYKREVILDEQQMLVVKVMSNEIENQTAFRYNSNATPLYDRLYDVFCIPSASLDVPNIYTKSQGIKMSVNTYPVINEDEEYPFYIEMKQNGTLSLSIKELNSIPEQYPLYLEDVQENYVQDLRQNNQYTFNYTKNTIKEFKIHFKDATGVYEETLESYTFNCSLNNQKLRVKYLGDKSFNGSAKINVYNLAGQQILSTQTNEVDFETDFSGASSSYLVHIVYDKKSFSTKVYNKQ